MTGYERKVIFELKFTRSTYKAAAAACRNVDDSFLIYLLFKKNTATVGEKKWKLNEKS